MFRLGSPNTKQLRIKFMKWDRFMSGHVENTELCIEISSCSLSCSCWMEQLFNELNKAMAWALEAAIQWTHCFVSSAQSRCKRYISITKWERYNKEHIDDDHGNLSQTGSNKLFFYRSWTNCSCNRFCEAFKWMAAKETENTTWMGAKIQMTTSCSFHIIICYI